MRLRRNSTSQKRTTRRSLRLALAIALAGSTWTTGNADAAPPELPACHEATHANAGLLPYPFSDTTARRSATSQRLVNLLGLGSQAPAQRLTQGAKLLPKTLVTTETAATAPLAVATADAGLVVPASGSQTAQSAGPALPAAPSLPALDTATDLSTVEPLEDSLSESLSDIEIPMDIAFGHTVSPVEPVIADQPATAQPTAVAAPKLPTLSLSAGPGLPTVEVCEPLKLPSESTGTAAHSGTHGATASARQPAIVPTAKSMSLTGGAGDKRPTVGQAEKQQAEKQVVFNLNDATPAVGSSERSPNRSSEGASRGAQMHLSSSNEPTGKALQSGSPKPAGMQIRIEGEPAPMLSAASNNFNLNDRAAPLPLMEAGLIGTPAESTPATPTLAMSTSAMSTSATSTSAMTTPATSTSAMTTPATSTSAMTTPATSTSALLSAKKSVKAMFASRTASVAASTSRPAVSPEAVDDMLMSDALAVGLQDSQSLITEFSIAELSVEHPNICQLLKTGERSVSLIGMRPGTTRIALVTFDEQGERLVQVHEVAVGDGGSAKSSLPDLAREMSQAIERLYPHSDVQVVAGKENLVVRGFTNYEGDAKKIVSLVRKTSLVPVVDQVVTNGQ